MSGLRESENLKLKLQKIQLATNNFQTCIGKGGYGWVYKGQLSIAGKPTTVAVKRLNEQFGQGLKEFLMEIQLLTGQNHPNLISLLGYCDEENEKIIVYEYAEHGSLDRYLTSSNTDYTPLTWRERLRICIDAARGLDHLHNHVGIHQTIIHRDIKSANILLDENWVAKISDLGLSKLSLAGLNRSAVISHPCGTAGYCEPEYFLTGIVKKESDVYSFGMVLFEVLCGRLCSFRHDDGLWLSAQLAKDYYEKKKLIEIIDPCVRDEMSLESMNKFSAIAYMCLQDDRGGRPAIDLVVKELIESLKIQVEYELEKEKKLKQHHVGLEFDDSDEYWETKLPREWQVITKMLNIPPAIKKELFSFLRKGILFDESNKTQHNQEIASLSASEEDDRDEDAYWEKKLPSDYQHYIYMSNDYLHYTTKKELYFLLCAGFLAYSGKLWFSLCKFTSGICSMLPASEILSQNYDDQSSDTSSLSESRFSEVKRLKGADEYQFTCKLRSPMFSPHHVYACYLVFKFADINIQLDEARKTIVYYSLDGDLQTINFLNFNLLPPMNIPTIKQKNDYGLHDLSSNIPRIEGLEIPDFSMYHAKEGWMQQREDGWMEVIICKALRQLEDHKLLQVTFKYKYLHGIIVEGIEFRPMQEYS